MTLINRIYSEWKSVALELMIDRNRKIERERQRDRQRDRQRESEREREELDKNILQLRAQSYTE